MHLGSLLLAVLIGCVLVNCAGWYFLFHKSPLCSPWNWRVLLGSKAYVRWDYKRRGWVSNRQRQQLARAEAESAELKKKNAGLHDEVDLVAWERDGARKREVILAVRCQQLLNRIAGLEQENAAKDRRTDDVREAWRFELRRADAAELEAQKAKAEAAAALLVIDEAQQDADTAVELAQKALAALVAKDTELTEVQRALEAAVGSGVDREFRQ